MPLQQHMLHHHTNLWHWHPFPHQPVQPSLRPPRAPPLQQLMGEVEQTTEFKVHSLPLARIKKIMKADEDVKMISGEAPVVFARACEMFILELTLRAWLHTEENKRHTLQRNDVTAAITRTDIFDFLVDIIPPEELKVDAGAGMPPAPATAPAPAPAVQTVVPPYVPGMAAVPFGVYANQQPVSFIWPLPEQQQQQQSSDGGRDE